MSQQQSIEINIRATLKCAFFCIQISMEKALLWRSVLWRRAQKIKVFLGRSKAADNWCWSETKAHNMILKFQLKRSFCCCRCSLRISCNILSHGQVSTFHRSKRLKEEKRNEKKFEFSRTRRTDGWFIFSGMKLSQVVGICHHHTVKAMMKNQQTNKSGNCKYNETRYWLLTGRKNCSPCLE